MPPQFTATNGCLLRRLHVWIARATTSLPVPVSPVRRTDMSVGAIRAAHSTIPFIAALTATSPPYSGRRTLSGSAPAAADVQNSPPSWHDRGGSELQLLSASALSRPPDLLHMRTFPPSR